MAKIFFAYRRKAANEAAKDRWRKAVSVLDRELSPIESFQPAPSDHVSDDHHFLYIFNPHAQAIQRRGFSFCVGSMFTLDEAWEKPAERPKNAPLVVYNQEQQVKVLTDSLGSRCLWYYQDDEVFILSTSQRAMAIYLQSFEINPQAISWMLATGCTGPGHAWDVRIKALGPGASLSFDKVTWKIDHRNTVCLINK